MEMFGLKVQPKNHTHTPRSARECEGINHTFPSGLPLWELETLWTLESSENNLTGQNSLD
jgi:hypothetical protein